MLLEKRCQKTCSMQGCYTPAICLKKKEQYLQSTVKWDMPVYNQELLHHWDPESTWTKTPKRISDSSNGMLDHSDQPFYWVKAETLVKISKQNQNIYLKASGSRRKKSNKISYFSSTDAFANPRPGWRMRRLNETFGIFFEELSAQNQNSELTMGRSSGKSQALGSFLEGYTTEVTVKRKYAGPPRSWILVSIV